MFYFWLVLFESETPLKLAQKLKGLRSRTSDDELRLDVEFKCCIWMTVKP